MQSFIKTANSQKWQQYAKKDQQQFVMTYADMDKAISPKFKKLIAQKVLAANNFTYKYEPKEYFQAIISWYRTRHRSLALEAVALKVQWIVEAPSTNNHFLITLLAFTKENDEILIMTPVYSFFKECAGRFKRRVIESPLKVSKKGNIAKYDIDVKDVEKQCGRGDISLMVICNPHNPSGRVWTKETLKALLNICQKNQVLIYSDEILCDLAFLKHSFNTLVSSGYEKVIVCNSISKAFNVSSLRGGYGIIENEGVRKRYMQFATAMNIHTSEITYHCIPVFYRRQGAIWLRETKQEILLNYNYLIEKLKHTKLIVHVLEAAYLVVIDFKHYAPILAKRYLEQDPSQVSESSLTLLTSELAKFHIIPLSMNNYYGKVRNSSEARFAIAVQHNYFRRFVLKLESFHARFDLSLVNAKL